MCVKKFGLLHTKRITEHLSNKISRSIRLSASILHPFAGKGENADARECPENGLTVMLLDYFRNCRGNSSIGLHLCPGH